MGAGGLGARHPNAKTTVKTGSRNPRSPSWSPSDRTSCEEDNQDAEDQEEEAGGDTVTSASLLGQSEAGHEQGQGEGQGEGPEEGPEKGL